MHKMYLCQSFHSSALSKIVFTVCLLAQLCLTFAIGYMLERLMTIADVTIIQLRLLHGMLHKDF